MPKVLRIAGEKIERGQRSQIIIDIARLYDFTGVGMPIEVVRGEQAGPTMFVSAAIHGDEINGVEIVKRLLRRIKARSLRGCLIAVPIVNVFGFNNRSRYLPDRRDLNRSFPGASTGSLAARLADLFMREIVSKCSHGIDLHTGALHRSNLPQIRACLDNRETMQMAKSFGVPVILNAELRDGSLREAARRKKVAMLLFEGGEALRFDENVIRSGLRGCLSVMRQIGMLPETAISKKQKETKQYVAQDSYWIRAPHSGSFRSVVRLGDMVKEGQVLAVISNPFGGDEVQVKVSAPGIVIGMSMIPLVNRGDAMYHIATFDNLHGVKKALDLDEEAL